MPNSLLNPELIQAAGADFHLAQPNGCKCVAAPAPGLDESFLIFVNRLFDVSLATMEKLSGKSSPLFAPAMDDFLKASVVLELHQFWLLNQSRPAITPDGNN